MKLKKTQKYQCRGWLFIHYKILKKSCIDIGREFNYSSSTIWRHAVKFGFKRSKSEALSLRLKNVDRKMQKNPNWKEWNDLTKVQKHARMRKIIPKPNTCPICNKNRKLLIANKDHTYKNKKSEWMWSCYPCHEQYDRKENSKNINIKRDSHGKFT